MDGRIQVELLSQVLDERLDLPQLMLVDRHRFGFDFQGQPPLQQPADPLLKTSERAEHLRDLLKGLRGRPVAAHVDRERGICRQEVSEVIGDRRGIGKEVQDEATSFCPPINLFKLRMYKNFSASKGHPENTGISQLIEYPKDLRHGQLLAQMQVFSG